MLKQADHIEALLKDPMSRIQLPASFSLSEFEIEVKALHQECRSILLEFVQVARAWQDYFPDQMQVVRIVDRTGAPCLVLPIEADFLPIFYLKLAELPQQ
jgi:hypothetical protein